MHSTRTNGIIDSTVNCFLDCTNVFLFFLQGGTIILPLFLRTVDNHGNVEITETVIFVKCRDSAKMWCFCRVFCQNAVVLGFHKNILFLISII